MIDAQHSTAQHELSDSDSLLPAFERFYEHVYVQEFPDPDERESLDNIRAYLALKRQGWYEANNYHVLALVEQGVIVAASISDYLARPKAGVIEFLVVDPALRGKGLGTRIHSWTVDVLDRDARQAGSTGLDLVAAEMNDPFQTDCRTDSLDPFTRAAIWGSWGYRKLLFPYVQPSLDVGKRRVENLLLMARSIPQAQTPISGSRIALLVQEYMRWAMRIEEPAEHPDFRHMRDWLSCHPSVESVGLDEYIGSAGSRPFITTEITTVGSAFAQLIDVYLSAFPPGPTAVDPEEFSRLLHCPALPDPSAKYHLWLLRLAEEEPAEGMASFFSLSGAGFLGYVVLKGHLEGTGRLRDLIARIERAILCNNPRATGLYAECEPGSPALRRLQRVGFVPLPIDYRQPPLPSSANASPEGTLPLMLMYKEFGRRSTPPTLSVSQLLASLEQIFLVVYGLDSPSLERSRRYWQAALGEPTGMVLPASTNVEYGPPV